MHFYHIIGRNKKKTKGITIAVEVDFHPAASTAKFVHCGVSYCAPMEANFSRPLGRSIAGGRLKCLRRLPNKERFSVAVSKDMSRREMKWTVLKVLLANTTLPWAAGLIRRELEYLEGARAEQTAS